MQNLLNIIKKLGIEFKTYVSNSKKSFEDKASEIKSKKDDDYDIGVNDIKKAHTNIPKKLGYLTIIIGFLIIVVMTFIIVHKQVVAVSEKKVIAKKPQNGVVDISMDSQAWKHYQSKRIDVVVKNVKEAIKKNQKKIISSLSEYKSNIDKDNNMTEQKVKSYTDNIDKKLQKFQKNINEKLKLTVKTINKEVEKNKNNNLPAQNIALNDKSTLLPPPLNSIKNNSKHMVLQPHKNTIKKKKKEQIKKEHVKIVNPGDNEYDYGDIQIDNNQIASTNISTALYEDTKKVTPKKRKIQFHIMKGLTKATLLTGVNAPTFGGSNNKNPAPILFSVDGDTIIANYGDEKLQDCLVTGSATGNVNTGKADVLLTDISCSGYDTNGNKVKIEQPIKGWVIGEDGSFGLQGRIVDSSGKVITKMIALDMLKSLTTAFMLSKQQAYTGGTIGTGTVGVTPNYGSSAASGLGQGVQRGIGHVFEHYNQILTGMYPTISVRAGKKVTLLLKGGEDVVPKVYKKVDISEEFKNEK